MSLFRGRAGLVATDSQELQAGSRSVTRGVWTGSMEHVLLRRDLFPTFSCLTSWLQRPYRLLLLSTSFSCLCNEWQIWVCRLLASSGIQHVYHGLTALAWTTVYMPWIPNFSSFSADQVFRILHGSPTPTFANKQSSFLQFVQPHTWKGTCTRCVIFSRLFLGAV